MSDRSFIVLCSKRGTRQAEERTGTFRINLQRLVESDFRFLPAFETLTDFTAQDESVAPRPVVAVELFELTQGVLVFFLGEIGARFEVAERKEVGPCLGDKLPALAAEFLFFLVAHFLDAFLLSLLNLAGRRA